MSPADDRTHPEHGSPDNDQRPGALGGALPPVAPPPALETRVLDTLTGRGLLSATARPSRRAPLWRVARALVAAAVVFAAGALVGRASKPAVALPTAGPRFVLLLYGGDSAGPHEAARVEEHRQWARALAAQGRAVSGEKLAPTSTRLDPGGTSGAASGDDRALGGFFIIGADDADDAAAIARTSPLLRHGGHIVVRPIDGRR